MIKMAHEWSLRDKPIIWSEYPENFSSFEKDVITFSSADRVKI